MAGVVKGMDVTLKSMNLEKVSGRKKGICIWVLNILKCFQCSDLMVILHSDCSDICFDGEV